MSKTDPKTEIKTVKVKLLKAHEHAGMQYGEGAEITVPEIDAVWLINMGVVADPKATTQTTPPVEGK